IAGLRRAAGGSLQEQAAANGLQPRRVDEVSRLQHAQLLNASVAGLGNGYSAIFTDRKGLYFVRQSDAWLQWIAVGGDDTTVGIQMKTAVAGIADVAVGHQDLEEPPTVDGHIQRLLGRLQGAGGENLLGAGHAHPGTQ